MSGKLARVDRGVRAPTTFTHLRVWTERFVVFWRNLCRFSQHIYPDGAQSKSLSFARLRARARVCACARARV